VILSFRQHQCVLPDKILKGFYRFGSIKLWAAGAGYHPYCAVASPHKHLPPLKSAENYHRVLNLRPKNALQKSCLTLELK